MAPRINSPIELVGFIQRENPGDSIWPLEDKLSMKEASPPGAESVVLQEDNPAIPEKRDRCSR
jgi:hypothetical protein